MWFVPRDKLQLLTSKEGMGTYTFNKHVIKHHFCQTRGMHPYAEAADPKGNRMAAINIRYKTLMVGQYERNEAGQKQAQININH